jgi:hypothetical protein
MTADLLRDTLAWTSLIHLGLLAWWFLFFSLAHEWTYRFHTRCFRVPPEQFDEIHYSGMGLYLMAIILFSLVPYLALRIVT